MSVRRRITLIAFILLALIMIRGAYMLLANVRPNSDIGEDFKYYYTAAWIVRGHSSQAIYSGIRNGADPTEDGSEPNSIYAQTAHAHGVTEIFSYVYPPTLADLLMPLTFLPISTALYAWWVLSIGALAGAGILFVRTPGLELSGYDVPFIVFLFVSTPTIDCLKCGQVSILLLFLVACGISLYERGNKYSAGLLLALAIAIKLTPLILLIPFIAWGDWKGLRAIALWCGVIAGILLAVNGWGTLELYFFQVLPSLGNRYIEIESRTLNTVVRVLWSRSETGLATPGAVWVGKLVSGLVICFAGWLSFISHENSTRRRVRVETIAFFLFLSCCVAPVSWRHAYVLAAPALLILFRRAWEGQSTIFEDATLVTFIFALTTNRFLQQSLLTPLAGTVLCLLALYRLRGARPFVRSSREPIEVPTA